MNKAMILTTGAVLAAASLPMAAAFQDAPPVGTQAPAAVPVLDEKSREILTSLSEFYAKQKNVVFKAKFEMTAAQGANKQERKLSSDVVAERPNKVSMRSDAAMRVEIGGSTVHEQEASASVTSDGTTVTYLIEEPNIGKIYVEKAAPPTLAGLAEQEEWATVDQGFGVAGWVLELMTGEGLESFLEHAMIERAEYVDEHEADGKTFHRVRIHQPGNPMTGGASMSAMLWVEKGEQPWLGRVQPDTAVLEDIARRQGTELEIEIGIALSDWQADQEPGPDRFTFTPPEGAKKYGSFQEAAAAAMQGMGGAGAEEQPGAADEGAARSAEDLRGAEAPAFTLENLEGESISLAQHKGKDIVVLDFWATWCLPCVKAMPTLVEVASGFKDQNVVLYAVNLKEPAEKVKAFLESKKIDVKVLLDTTGDVGDLYLARLIPQTVIIGKDGTVQAVHVGAGTELKERLTEELQTLVDGGTLAE